jgi:hypothetical protein
MIANYMGGLNPGVYKVLLLFFNKETNLFIVYIICIILTRELCRLLLIHYKHLH